MAGETPNTKKRQLEEIREAARETAKAVVEAQAEAKGVKIPPPRKMPEKYKVQASEDDLYELCKEAQGKAEELGHRLGPWVRGQPEEGRTPIRLPNPLFRISRCVGCGKEVIARFMPPPANYQNFRRYKNTYSVPMISGRLFSDACEGVVADGPSMSRTEDAYILNAR